MTKETKLISVKDRIEKTKELLKKILDQFPEGSSVTIGIHAEGISLDDFAGSDVLVKIEPNVASQEKGIRGTSDFHADEKISGTVFFPITEERGSVGGSI